MGLLNEIMYTYIRSTLIKYISCLISSRITINYIKYLNKSYFIAAEDGVIRFWHSNTYKLETSLNYNMERVWSLDIGKDNTIAFGFDEGTVVVKIG